MQDKEHLLSTLGLCARARALVVGTPLLCETLRAGNGRILCVLEASDTSANTHKRLTDKCTYYRVPLHRLEADAGTLGRAVGKTGAERLPGAGFPADCRGQGGQSAGISAENLLPHFVKQFRLCVFNRQCPPRQRRFRRLIGYILGAGR